MAIKCKVCGDDSETGQRYCGEVLCPMKNEGDRGAPETAQPATQPATQPAIESFLDVTTGKVVHEIVPPS